LKGEKIIYQQISNLSILNLVAFSISTSTKTKQYLQQKTATKIRGGVFICFNIDKSAYVHMRTRTTLFASV